MPITVCRKEHFNAAHRLHNPKWSDQKNERVFGLCNSPNFHGHNYVLIVELQGPQDPDTAYVYDLKKLSEMIRKEICERYDHRNLNLDIEEFRDCIPTTENFARIIYDRLLPHIPVEYRFRVILYETEKNYVKYSR